MKITKKIVGFNVNNGDTAETEAPPAKAQSVKADVIQMHETLQRPEKLIGSTYKLKVPEHVSGHAMYITINDIIYMPSIIAEIGNVIEHHLIEIGMLKGPEIDPAQQKIIDEKKAELLKESNTNTEQASESSTDASTEDAWQSNASMCAKCNQKAVMVRDGCATCLNCGDSKCG